MSAFKQIESLVKQEIWVARTRYYVVGCNVKETVFRILEIDRTVPGQLHITDSGPYSKQLVDDKMAEFRLMHARTGGLAKIPHAISLLGVLSLPRYYLVLIKDKELVGQICGHKVYGLKETVLIPVCHDSFCPATPDFTEASPRYKELVESLELSNKTDYFFSYTYDLTHSMQANFQQRNSATCYHEKYTWNMHMALEFLSAVPHGSMWLTCLVYGFFEHVDLIEGPSRTGMTLLGRRSRHMAGTRFIKRGIDGSGNVANEVESEVVMECYATGMVSSLIVLRGSIPLYWSQRKEAEKDFSFSPPIVVATEKNVNLSTTQVHFQNLIQEYGGKVVVLSLIRKKEKKAKEQKLGFALDGALARVNQQFNDVNSPEVAYYAYDFLDNGKKAHEDIKKIMSEDVKALGVFSVNYKTFNDSSLPPSPSTSTPASPRNASANPFDELSAAAQNVSEDVFADLEVSLTDVQSSKLSESSLTVPSSFAGKWTTEPKFQKGIARINCVDCLDRTNVAQFCVARLALKQQLRQIGVDEAGAQQYYEALARMFTLHGDRIAYQYAGSAAMHKDRIAHSQRADGEDDDDAEQDDESEDGKEEEVVTDMMVEAQLKPSALIAGMTSARTLGYGIFKSASGVAKNAFSATKRVVKNNFMDTEKQQAMNVFLGVYIPTFHYPAVSPLVTSSSSTSIDSLAALPLSTAGAAASSSATTAPAFSFGLSATNPPLTTTPIALLTLPTLTTTTITIPVDTLATLLPLTTASTSSTSSTSATSATFSTSSTAAAFTHTTNNNTTVLTTSTSTAPVLKSMMADGRVSPATVMHFENVAGIEAEALSPTTAELFVADAEDLHQRKPHIWEMDEGAVPHDSRKKFPHQQFPYPESISMTAQPNIGTLRRKVSEFDMFMTEAEVKSRDVNVADDLRKRNPNVLFLITTSKPNNVVVVEANLTSAGKLVLEQPVDVYWLKQRTREGVNTMEKEKLSMIESKFLFGVKSQIVVIPAGQPGAGQQRLKLWLTILPGRPFLIKPQDGKGFAAFMMVRGALCEMVQVFMATAERSIGPPKVEHIFVYARDSSGMAVEERVPMSMIGRKGR